jgi:hypothetical protein
MPRDDGKYIKYYPSSLFLASGLVAVDEDVAISAYSGRLPVELPGLVVAGGGQPRADRGRLDVGVERGLERVFVPDVIRIW